MMRARRVSEQRVALPRHEPMGFTVVEVLVAAAILVLALLGIASMMPTADMSLHQSGQISKAVSLCSEMIETIKNDPFNALLNYNGADTRNPGAFPLDDPDPIVPGTPGNFMGRSNLTKWKNDIALYLASGAGITGGYGTIAVSSVAQDGTGNDILRKVTVTVYWTDSRRPYQVRLETLASAI
jgi:hypothetical protein